MTEPNLTVSWEATVSGVTSGSLGYAMVWDGSSYAPATTANRATYVDVMAVLRSVPVNNTAILQSTGPLSRTITGFAATDTGWAIVGSLGQLTFTASAPADSDYVVGRVVLGLTHLVLEAENTLALVTAVAASDDGLINVVDYGADPTGVADSTAEVLLAIAAMSDGYTLYFPPGVYTISETLSLQLRAVRILGAGSRVCSGIMSTEVRFVKTMHTGAAGSLEKMYNGTADPTYTSTHFNYLRLTGASGLSSADKGRRMRLGAANGASGFAANSAWNCVGVIVQIDSATQCVVGVPYIATDATVAGNTDANNGAIRWEVLHPFWKIMGRDVTFESINCTVYGGATVYPSAFVESTQSPGGSPCSHLRFNGMFAGSIDGVARARAGTDQGPDYLPTAGGLYAAIEGGYERPFCPYQNDFSFYEYCLFEYCDYAHTTGNPTGQCRGNVSICTGYNNAGGILGNTFRFLNDADKLQDGASGSIAMNFIACGGGEFTASYAVDTIKPNAMTSFQDCYFEGTIPGWSRCYVGGVTERPFAMTNCVFRVSNAVSTAWIDWTNGPYAASNCQFFFDGGCTGATFNVHGGSTSAPAKAVFDNCTFPSAADVGGELLSVDTVGSIERRGCREITLATQYSVPTPDKKIQLGLLATQGGSYLQNVKGLSAAWVDTNNLAGTATVTGAATTAVLTFPTAETTATKLYAWASPIASTGGPAVNSNIPLTVVCTTTTATVTVMAAPGGAATVTFAIFLARGP